MEARPVLRVLSHKTAQRFDPMLPVHNEERLPIRA